MFADQVTDGLDLKQTGMVHDSGNMEFFLFHLLWIQRNFHQFRVEFILVTRDFIVSEL